MTLVVNRQQQLLQEIFDLIGQASEPPSQIESQSRCQLVQEDPICRGVAGETL
jgi:hypothetical protein